MTQKKDNKGFSLVELIVVVAIMAVLMGILVPTLVRNVEKSKKQKDLSAIEEIRNTMQINLADPEYSAIDKDFTADCDNIEVSKFTGTATEKKYIEDVAEQVKDYKCKSKEFTKSGCKVTFIVEDEAVYYKITGTKSGDKYYSENTPASSNN